MVVSELLYHTASSYMVISQVHKTAQTEILYFVQKRIQSMTAFKVK